MVDASTDRVLLDATLGVRWRAGIVKVPRSRVGQADAAFAALLSAAG